jgi:hypothetical protein
MFKPLNCYDWSFFIVYSSHVYSLRFYYYWLKIDLWIDDQVFRLKFTRVR